MTKTAFTPAMLFTIIFLLLITLNNNGFAAQEAIVVEGREVLLKEDGSWIYQSTDRYAKTKDGQRVRLKVDGSWQYMDNAPLISTPQVGSAKLDMKLKKVVIEKVEKKVQKNIRVKTQTVFYVQVENSSQSKRRFSVKKNDISLIKVKDNNGKNYPVLSIQPDSMQLEPNTESTIIVRAEKSPLKWDKVKLMEIVFKAGVFGIENPITLSQRTIDFEEQKVTGF